MISSVTIYCLQKPKLNIVSPTIYPYLKLLKINNVFPMRISAKCDANGFPRIWTQITDFISSDRNFLAKSGSLYSFIRILFLWVYICVSFCAYVYMWVGGCLFGYWYPTYNHCPIWPNYLSSTTNNYLLFFLSLIPSRSFFCIVLCPFLFILYSFSWLYLSLFFSPRRTIFLFLFSLLSHLPLLWFNFLPIPAD